MAAQLLLSKSVPPPSRYRTEGFDVSYCRVAILSPIPRTDSSVPLMLQDCRFDLRGSLTFNHVRRVGHDVFYGFRPKK